MPIYEYQCPNCERIVEILRPYEKMDWPVLCQCCKDDGKYIEYYTMKLLMSRHNNFQWDEFVTQLRKDQAPATAHRQTLRDKSFANETTRRQNAKQKIDHDKERYLDQGWKKKTFYPGGSSR